MQEVRSRLGSEQINVRRVVHGIIVECRLPLAWDIFLNAPFEVQNKVIKQKELYL